MTVSRTAFAMLGLLLALPSIGAAATRIGSGCDRGEVGGRIRARTDRTSGRSDPSGPTPVAGQTRGASALGGRDFGEGDVVGTITLLRRWTR